MEAEKSGHAPRNLQMGEEFHSVHAQGADKSKYKPPGYNAMAYAPLHKIESEAQLSAVPQDKLNSAYTLWVMVREEIYQNKRSRAYDESDLQEVTSFDTIQSFWMVYQHLRRPTAMPYGTTLHFFKDGLKPQWENPKFAKGCRLQFKSGKEKTSKYWEDLLLALIGEQIGTKASTVAGVVLNLKPQFDKVGIWMTDCDDQEETAAVKAQLMDILKLEEHELQYQVFHGADGAEGGETRGRGRGGWDRGRGRGRGGRGFLRGAARGGRGGGENNFYRVDLAKADDKPEGAHEEGEASATTETKEE